jgi:hypothetical protein
MEDPPNALNIIIKRVCQKFRHRHGPIKQHREALSSARARVAHTIRHDDGTGASTSLGNAWLKVFGHTGNQSDDKQEMEVPLGGAIRTRGSSWHPFSFKEGILVLENSGKEEARQTVPDLDLA